MRTTLTLLSLLTLLAASGVAHANITWTWTNAGTGTEQGTFVTNGDLVGNEAPAGSYTLLDFTVDASAHGLVLGSFLAGDYITFQPDMGFDWDGSEPTVFWRSSGTYTNGFSLAVAAPEPGAPDYIGFNVDWFRVQIYYGTVFLAEGQTPIIAPKTNGVADGTSSFGRVKALYR